jgi:SAM-dependent methyltransferase
MPYGYVEVRRNALCPRCLALERHRLLWLWLSRETDLLQSTPKFLHIAPEVCLMKKFEAIYAGKNDIVVKNAPVQGLRRNLRGSLLDVNDRADFEHNAAEGCFSRQYITLDLESPLAKVHADVQALPFPDATFDVVFCNHVLEHVADDRLAMREMRRVMRPGGWGVMLSPVDEARAATFEDDAITDPAERTRLFGQYDHRRVYGRDYADRLREAGFEVDEVDYFAALPPARQRLYGLRKEILYIVKAL